MRTVTISRVDRIAGNVMNGSDAAIPLAFVVACFAVCLETGIGAKCEARLFTSPCCEDGEEEARCRDATAIARLLSGQVAMIGASVIHGWKILTAATWSGDQPGTPPM